VLRYTITAWLLLALLAAFAYICWSCGDAAFGAPKRCATVRSCHHALDWARKDRQHLRHRLAIRYHRDASYAIRLASAAFGVPVRDMRRIAQCESGMGAQATAEAGSGASGVFQFLRSTWRHTPFAGFDVFDPVANSLAAAQLVVHDGGWRQWSCSSITGVR
jgi:hypothetical protein